MPHGTVDWDLSEGEPEPVAETAVAQRWGKAKRMVAARIEIKLCQSELRSKAQFGSNASTSMPSPAIGAQKSATGFGRAFDWVKGPWQG